VGLGPDVGHGDQRREVAAFASKAADPAELAVEDQPNDIDGRTAGPLGRRRDRRLVRLRFADESGLKPIVEIVDRAHEFPAQVKLTASQPALGAVKWLPLHIQSTTRLASGGFHLRLSRYLALQLAIIPR
jgi:hypothetical protein